jgi:Protein of unknown function (DUF3987)
MTRQEIQQLDGAAGNSSNDFPSQRENRLFHLGLLCPACLRTGVDTSLRTETWMGGTRNEHANPDQNPPAAATCWVDPWKSAVDSQDRKSIRSPALLSSVGQHVSRTAEPWPAPRPLAGALAEVCPFDPKLVPEALRTWVLDVAERLQVPADYPAATLLVMLAGALGRRALIRPQRYDNWLVIPNLWGAMIGRSGVMKSAVLRAVLGPLRHRQALAMAIYESERDA